LIVASFPATVPTTVISSASSPFPIIVVTRATSALEVRDARGGETTGGESLAADTRPDDGIDLQVVVLELLQYVTEGEEVIDRYRRSDVHALQLGGHFSKLLIHVNQRYVSIGERSAHGIINTLHKIN
jgi:hypothetical protein